MTERESGGYFTSVVAGPGPAIREVSIATSPGAATALAAVEQTFTVPGLLATDRIAYVSLVSPSSVPVFSSSNGALGLARVSAISVIAIPFIAAGTSAGTVSTGTSLNGITLAIGIASKRGA